MSKDFGFDTVNAKEEFLEFFGEKHLWFWDVIEAVRKAKVKYDFNVTDVLIKKNVILFGILKNFFDVYEFVSKKEARVSESLIRDLVDVYCRKLGIEGRGRTFDFAINCYGYGVFRINYSESVSSPVLNIRVLDFKIPDLIENLGCPQVYYSFLKNEVLQKEVFNFGKLGGQENREIFSYRVRKGGLIIHAGETGSGKTTFIASELQFFADKISGLIVTYEKPVEYRFIGPYSARVIQYDLDIHLREEDIHRHFLRNSPHVGFFYEVRDRDDFIKVVDLAARGHLVLTTLHASNVYEVFSLFGFFEEEVKQMFFTSLRAIVCHKLIFSREISRERGIIPVYEIFINSDQAGSIMNMFMKNEFLKLKTFLYKEKGYDRFISFADYFRGLREQSSEKL